MTSVFDGYDEEYKTLTSDISKKISDIKTYEDDAEKKKSSITHVGELIKQAKQLIQQMQLEVRSLDTATKRELTKKVDQYKDSLQSLSDDFKTIVEKEERDGLFGDRSDSEGEEGTTDRDRMAAATDKLRGTTSRIEAARRVIAETEDVAINITEELGKNREKIETTHAKVKNVNSMTRAGGKIIGRIRSRDKRQRMMIYGVLCFLCLAFVIILYYGIFGHRSANTPSTVEGSQ